VAAHELPFAPGRSHLIEMYGAALVQFLCHPPYFLLLGALWIANADERSRESIYPLVAPYPGARVDLIFEREGEPSAGLILEDFRGDWRRQCCKERHDALPFRSWRPQR
jgi:hypothetical protein